MQGWMKDIGIQLNLIPVSESKAYAVWADGDYDAYIWGWGGDPDPDFILSIFTTHQCLSWSDGCYSNASYDEMYSHQQTIFNRDDRKFVGPGLDQVDQLVRGVCSTFTGKVILTLFIQ